MMGVLEKFGGCPGDIRWVSWRYSMGALELYYVFPWHICLV